LATRRLTPPSDFQISPARRRQEKLQHCAHDNPSNSSLKLVSINRRNIMSSNSFWSNACKQAKNKPLQTLLAAAHGSCGATVRPARAADSALLAAA
jgi:hypothetical protein